MAAPKTQKTTGSVTAYLDAIHDTDRRADAKAVLKLKQAASGEKATMWGEAIVGFGSYATGTGERPLVGFSPRLGNFALRARRDGEGSQAPGEAQQAQGERAASYVTRLADVEAGARSEIVTRAADAMRKKG